MTNSTYTRSRQVCSWVVAVSLALSTLYALLSSARAMGGTFFVLHQRSMVKYSFNSVLASEALDPFVWGAAVVFVSAGLLWGLHSNRGLSRLRALLVLVPCILVGLPSLGLFGVLPLVLASGLLVILFVFLSYDSFGLSPLSSIKHLFFGGIFVSIFVEVAALAFYNIPVVMNFSVEASPLALHWQNVELSFSNLAYPFLPYVYLFFVVMGVVAFLWKVLSVSFAERWNHVGNWLLRRLRGLFESCKTGSCAPFSARFPLVFAVLISVVVSVVLVVVTVLPWVNPTYRLVSVDAPSYYVWLDRMRGLDVGSALSFAIANDRAAFLVLSYALSFVVGPVTVVQFAPALLVPLFCVVSLFVMRLVCGFRESWVYVLLIAPFSVQALGLIYSGYFANMLAVIFVYVCFVLLLRVFRSGSSFVVFCLLGASLLVLFSHSWTWYVLVLSLGLFLFLEWRSAVRDRNLWEHFKWKVTVVAGVIVSGLVCDLARKLLTNSSASVSVFETARSSLGFPDVAYVLGGLRLNTNFYLGGVFANGLLVVLCVLGFLFMLSFKSEMSRLLVCWVFVGCMPVLFASGEFVFNRFLFLMPSALFSGLGLCFLVRFCVYRSFGSRIKKLGAELLIVGFVLLVLLNFALRYVSNINIV